MCSKKINNTRWKFTLRTSASCVRSGCLYLDLCWENEVFHSYCKCGWRDARDSRLSINKTFLQCCVLSFGILLHRNIFFNKSFGFMQIKQLKYILVLFLRSKFVFLLSNYNCFVFNVVNVIITKLSRNLI